MVSLLNSHMMFRSVHIPYKEPCSFLRFIVSYPVARLDFQTCTSQAKIFSRLFIATRTDAGSWSSKFSQSESRQTDGPRSFGLSLFLLPLPLGILSHLVRCIAKSGKGILDSSQCPDEELTHGVNLVYSGTRSSSSAFQASCAVLIGTGCNTCGSGSSSSCSPCKCS